MIAIVTSKEMILMDCRTGEFTSCGSDYSVFNDNKEIRAIQESKFMDDDEEKQTQENMYKYSKGFLLFPFVSLISAFLPTVEHYSCANYMNRLAASQYESANNLKGFVEEGKHDVRERDGSRSESPSVPIKSIIATSDPPVESPLYSPARKKVNNENNPKPSNMRSKRLPPRSSSMSSSSTNISSSSSSFVANRKSSGYGTTQPIMKMGQSPSVALKKQKQALAKRKQMERQKTITRASMVYPIDCKPLSNPQPHNDFVDPSRTPISSVTFHPLATTLAITYNDFSVQICKVRQQNFSLSF